VIVREFRGDERASGTTHQVMLRVVDVDAVLEAARTAGADADDTARLEVLVNARLALSTPSVTGGF
jgi:hypothetical protein